VTWGSLNSACISAYGEDIEYTPAGGSVVAMKAVVDPGPLGEDEEPGVYVQLGLSVADIGSDPSAGDTVRIGSTDYVVVDVERDTTGWAKIVARRK